MSSLRPITKLLIVVAGIGVIVGAVAVGASLRPATASTAPASEPTPAAARSRPPRLVTATPATTDSAEPPGTPVVQGKLRIHPPTSPAEERAQFVQQVRASGPASGDWVEKATTALLDDLTKARRKGASSIRWQQPECFRTGCLIDVTFPDGPAFRAFDQVMGDAETTTFASWSGGTYRSPPIDQPQGKVLATWGLARPAQQ